MQSMGKGREERQKKKMWAISYFWIEVFLKDVLGLLDYEGTTFMLNLSSQGYTVWKFYCRTEISIFSIFFLYKIFAVTILNIIP